MPNRLGIQFSVDHEARFLSHHDTMRLLARAAERAKLKVAYSGGFNPRVKLSLPLPRPVGVAARQELLVLELAEPDESGQIVEKLAAQLPEGFALAGIMDLPSKRPQAESADYELPLSPEIAASVAKSLADLSARPNWPWIRGQEKEFAAAEASPNASEDGPPESGGEKLGGNLSGRKLNLRELITHIACDGSKLTFTLSPKEQVWARVDEVLALVGLDVHQRANVIRTEIRWRTKPEAKKVDSPADAADGKQE